VEARVIIVQLIAINADLHRRRQKGFLEGSVLRQQKAQPLRRRIDG